MTKELAELFELTKRLLKSDVPVPKCNIADAVKTLNTSNDDCLELQDILFFNSVAEHLKLENVSDKSTEVE